MAFVPRTQQRAAQLHAAGAECRSKTQHQQSAAQHGASACSNTDQAPQRQSGQEASAQAIRKSGRPFSGQQQSPARSSSTSSCVVVCLSVLWSVYVRVCTLFVSLSLCVCPESVVCECVSLQPSLTCPRVQKLCADMSRMSCLIAGCCGWQRSVRPGAVACGAGCHVWLSGLNADHAELETASLYGCDLVQHGLYPNDQCSLGRKARRVLQKATTDDVHRSGQVFSLAACRMPPGKIGRSSVL